MRQRQRTLPPALLLVAALGACGDERGGPDDVAEPFDVNLRDADADLGLPDVTDADVTADASEDPPLVRYTEERAPCLNRTPLRNLYWGDTHIHTRYSFDAWVVDTRATPSDAYRFARGEPMQILPLDENGEGTTRIQLDRPLDFAAVTDHSEYLAEIDGCTTPGSGAYDTDTCRQYRIADQNTVVAFGSRITSATPSRFAGICDAIDCAAESRRVWRRIRDEAEEWYDRSGACEFTTFQGYEYSSAVGISNLHRNVIFRNERTPDHVTSMFEEPIPDGLFDRLTVDCIEGIEGCEVLSIPHNSNWSNGNLFAIEYPAGASIEEQRALAQRRATLEPIVEIFQHKGDSECVNGLRSAAAAPDELCDFEKLRDTIGEDCRDGTGTGAMAGLGCTSRFDFVRYVLKEGLREAARIGVNPYALGITAATDTHNATGGWVREDAWPGHFGENEIEPEDRLADPPLTPGGIVMNPGGLTAVWAVENSRDAIFEAMQRREVYGTSGPRIGVRLFAGFDLDPEMCGAPDFAERGFAGGVPMGGDLTGSPESPLQIAVHAEADLGVEGRPGAPLQRIQIVKGWLDAEGELHEQVIDVAGDANNGATVDPDTCALVGEGATSLCTVWTDPEFDPTQHAFYYARVVENPTCRWSTWDCIRSAPEDRHPNCSDPSVPLTIQERAWTSPVWFTPGDVP